MTFNILEGGTKLGQPLSQSVRVIRDGEADVVVLQEHSGNATEIAEQLGFNFQALGRSVAVLSRYPITAKLQHCVKIQVADGREAWVFGVHLAPYPYGPYELRDKPGLAEAELIETARKTRGRQIKQVLQELAPHVAVGKAVFLAGDFNEPSHLDWTEKAAAAGLHFSRKVAWPTATAVCRAGLADSYRTVFPNEIEKPGLTWTPVPAQNEVHDRIDLIYHAGRGVRPIAAMLVGECAEFADIVVRPYPSDHRAVVVTFQLGP